MAEWRNDQGIFNTVTQEKVITFTPPCHIWIAITTNSDSKSSDIRKAESLSPKLIIVTEKFVDAHFKHLSLCHLSACRADPMFWITLKRAEV